MAVYSYGVVKSQEGVFDPITGAVSALKEIEVYQDTIKMEWPDATETPHFKQGDPNPKVIVRKAQPKTISFSVMDTSAASKKNWLGGEAVLVDGANVWSEPAVPLLSKVRALVFECEDGSVITIARADTTAKMNMEVTDGNINLIDVKAAITSTGVVDVAGFKWADPKVTP